MAMEVNESAETEAEAQTRRREWEFKELERGYAEARMAWLLRQVLIMTLRRVEDWKDAVRDGKEQGKEVDLFVPMDYLASDIFEILRVGGVEPETVEALRLEYCYALQFSAPELHTLLHR